MNRAFRGFAATGPGNCGHRPVRPEPRKLLRQVGLADFGPSPRNALILSDLWLAAALDAFRNWLIREAA